MNECEGIGLHVVLYCISNLQFILFLMSKVKIIPGKGVVPHTGTGSTCQPPAPFVHIEDNADMVHFSQPKSRALAKQRDYAT